MNLNNNRILDILKSNNLVQDPLIVFAPPYFLLYRFPIDYTTNVYYTGSISMGNNSIFANSIVFMITLF